MLHPGGLRCPTQQDPNQPNWKTTSYQTARLENYMDYFDTGLQKVSFSAWWPLKGSECCGACLCTIWCTLIALVFACVIIGALWLLWCLPVYELVHSECSGVRLCNNWCTLTALVLACVLFVALWLLCCLPVQSFVTPNALVFACELSVTLWLFWCLPIY